MAGILIPCRYPDYDEVDDNGNPKYYITLPEKWVGKHSVIEAQARKSAKEQGLEGQQVSFAVSLALLEDYCLPGMEGKKWDFNKLPLEIIAWVSTAAYGSYLVKMQVEKKFLLPLETG